MFLANILGEVDKTHINVDVNYIDLINFTNRVEDIDNKIPTLIIGWENIKKLYDDLNILNNEVIKDKVYWIFSKEEKISSYYIDLNNFILKLPELFINNYKIKIIDPIFENIINIDELFDLLTSYREYKVLDTNNILYIIYKKQQFIIDLNMFEYFNFNIRDIRVKLYKNVNQYIYDKNKKIYKNIFNKFENFNIFEKYLGVFYFQIDTKIFS